MIQLNSDQPASESGLRLSHRVRIDGQSGPFLVLVHGFGTDLNAWNKILPALLEHFRVVRFDLAGAGPNAAETFDPRRYNEVEAHADDVLEILGELGIQRCTYVGASVGGMIGALAAIERPKLFSRMAFLGASPRYLNDPESGYVGGFDQPALDGLYRAMSADYHGWVSGFAPLVIRGLPESEAVEEFARSLFALRPDIAFTSARSIFQSDFRSRLPLLEVPTVILQTANDIAVPLVVGDYLHANIADSTLEVLPAEGHYPHLSSPAVVADALLRHLL